TATVTERPSGGAGQWVIELVPKPTAAVVWGKVIVTIGADELPRETRFLDEKGEVVRTMTFSDVKEMGGRTLPTRFRVVPGDKPGEYTEMIYEDIQFDAKVPD